MRKFGDCNLSSRQDLLDKVRLRRLLRGALLLTSLALFACEDEAAEGELGAADAATTPVVRVDQGGVRPPLLTPDRAVSPDMMAACAPCEQCEERACNCPDGSAATVPSCDEAGCCLGEEAIATRCEQSCPALPPPECDAGARRCLADESGAYEQCDRNGRWQLIACPIGESCTEGRCLPDECTPGEALCLDGSARLSCDENGEWQPAPPCEGDTLCAAGQCESPTCANALFERSYIGCEYLAVELPNVTSATTPDTASAVVIGNPDESEPVRVTVTAPDGALAALIGSRRVTPPEDENLMSFLPQTIQSEVRDSQGAIVAQGFAQADALEIPPGGLATLLLPQQEWGEGSMVRAAAYRVNSDAPVSAYQFNPYCCNYSFSNDASLLIPTSALDTRYRFLGVPTWLRDFTVSPSPGAMAVVASENGTRVQIQSSAQTLPESGGRLQAQGPGRWEARLDANEVLLLRSGSAPATLFEVPPQPDLSGSVIEASAPVALFSTHDCAFYPSNLSACDHLEEQLFPTSTWGNQFALIPPVQRSNNPNEKVYWKIIAEGEGATVRLSVPPAAFEGSGPGYPGVPSCLDLIDPAEPLSIRLGAAGFCEMSARGPLLIEGDQSMMVLGIISGQGSTGSLGFGDQAGDPAIFLVPPVRQFRSRYQFLAPDTYANDFVTLVFTNGTQIELDGAPVDLSGAESIGESGYLYQHISLEDGAHRLGGTAPFGILVFAFDDFVSYAFTGGLNLTKR
ncbi:MAG: IgGFc-binding protein [Myxococcota bacterium]|nr:IgGFc-binding protein [Myxococcota bacterium]